MRSIEPRSRRVFLADFGKVVVGMAVLGACSDGEADPTTTAVSPSSSTTSASSTTQATTTQPPETSATTTEAPTSTEALAGSAAAWERVDLGNVSAYVVVRAGEAVVVDTGNPGSEAAIGDTIQALGLVWDDVAHLILTHRHPDHIGSTDAVMALAAGATAYAGAEDIPSINAPREIVVVGDSDIVSGLEIIETPGHTPGHISVLDTELSLLIAGDAMNGADGGVVGPNPRFTSDLEIANASVVKMAGFQFDTVVFGHGEPVIAGAADLVRALAAEL
ncbi:MAG: MBL fold metallo-hydrolase [Acidimicrobiia bacterium]|nr:MBL fold metallo-hydrolase [Acidimicrobiia bacterium]